ncbi:MAG: hypothetical protein J6Y92_06305 [Lentisphaeria bacterium]|nr:hypothetical protein [Lentisphaeria bacterium]
MEKNISLMNDLHKIDLSAAVNPSFMPEAETKPAQNGPIQLPVSKPLSEAVQRRLTDFRLSRRDLAVRVTESLAGIEREIADSERRLRELGPRRERLASIAEELSRENPLDAEGGVTQTQIAAESRRLEELRLDACRMIAETGTTTQNIPLPSQKSSSLEGIDWGSVTFGQLCRIGWGVFFPFIVSVILAALLIGAAVIAAFNGTIRW